MVTLRPCSAEDAEFLYRVYASSREREMSLLVDWNDVQKELFLRDQFRLQHHHYQTNYPDARYDIIEKNGEAIGRFYVARMRNEIRIMDIALLAEHRGQGVGRALLEDLLREATGARKFVSLHVEADNPAKRLYERMGFFVAGEVSFYELMHWIPPGLNPKFEAPDTSAS
jgi:ribosomal protein S18 acetylase RimI-like enzyme